MPYQFQMKKSLLVLLFALLHFSLAFSQTELQQRGLKIDGDWAYGIMFKKLTIIQAPMMPVGDNGYEILSTAGDEYFSHKMSGNMLLMVAEDTTINCIILRYDYLDLKSIWAKLKEEYGQWDSIKNQGEDGVMYCWNGLLTRLYFAIPKDEHQDIAIYVSPRW
jgi:hypothetical protein